MELIIKLTIKLSVYLLMKLSVCLSVNFLSNEPDDAHTIKKSKKRSKSDSPVPPFATWETVISGLPSRQLSSSRRESFAGSS
jgi:hypothetical protein